MSAALLTSLKRLFLAYSSIEAQLYPPLELPVRFRTFAPADREACLSIYRQNQTGRFPPDACKKFEALLEKEPRNLIVAELDSRVIGYGGIHLLRPEVAVLFYGIVAPEYQLQRVGATLVLLRLAQLPDQPTGYFVFIFAVEASMSAYYRFGFIRKSGWLDDTGKQHPIGLLRVSDPSLAKIRSTFRRRRIRLEGTLSLQPSSPRACTIERTAAGLQFSFGHPGDKSHL
jgi:predicted N-acetyltransferase YhbS